MKSKLIKNNKSDLLIFLTGWGCDSGQFEFLNSYDYDVLICYNYSDLELDFDFSKYKKFYLIAFSAGVYVASLIKEKLPVIEKSYAINGSQIPYDKYFGLPDEITDVFCNLAKENVIDFRRKYLLYNEKELCLFGKTISERTFDDCRKELFSLKKFESMQAEQYKFDFAILSCNDKIFCPDKQKEYWTSKAKCIFIKDSAHFPFFKWKSFDEILSLN